MNPRPNASRNKKRETHGIEHDSVTAADLQSTVFHVVKRKASALCFGRSLAAN
jgi:hypothetical protein